MKHRITLIPGDGIGPEVAASVVHIIEAAGAEIEWETHYAGAQAVEKFGETLPKELLESIKRNKVALKGPVTTPIGKGFTSVNVGLRKALDLYANVRPIRALPNVPCRYPELNLVVVRENTEGLYAHRAFCLRLCSERKTEEDNLRAQGEHYEALRRIIPQVL